jgi:hypothetical protein
VKEEIDTSINETTQRERARQQGNDKATNVGFWWNHIVPGVVYKCGPKKRKGSDMQQEKTQSPRVAKRQHEAAMSV